MGKPTTGRGGVLAYLYYKSQFLYISLSKSTYSFLQSPAFCKSDFSFFCGGCANYLCNLTKVLHLSLLSISSNLTENTSTGISSILSIGIQ